MIASELLAEVQRLSIAGWILMIGCVAGVCGLCAFCLRRVVGGPKPSDGGRRPSDAGWPDRSE